MRPVITAAMLKEYDGYVSRGDIIYMANPVTAADTVALAHRLKRGGFFRDSAFRREQEFGESAMPSFGITLLEQKYLSYLGTTNGREPPWISLCPTELRRYLRYQKAIHGPPHEPYAIAHLPFSGVRYVITEGGLTEQTVNVFGLGRLAHIGQLGYLQDPSVAQYGAGSYPSKFNHTRFVHSLDVRVLASLMAINNRLPRLWRNTLAIAALTHDARTPAGGDTTKLVDPEMFDEDLHYPEILEEIDWDDLRRRYRIPPQLLIDTVQGKGTLGQFLDAADKFAYVSRDLAVCQLMDGGQSPFYPAPAWFRPFSDIIKRNPQICSIWDAAQVDPSGRVYFTDASRLGEFLLARVTLFRELYLHPAARFREFLLSGFLIKLFYERGEITVNQLLTMTDYDLERFIDKKTGKRDTLHMMDASEGVRFASFETLAEAKRHEEVLIANDALITLIENVTHTINPATHFLVLGEDGTLRTFHDQMPAEAFLIEEYAKVPDPYRLYWALHTTRFFDEPFLGLLRGAVAARRQY